LQSLLDTICKVNYTKFARLTLQYGGVGLKTKIQELRKHNKISQEELAMAVGVTRQTITSLECEKYTSSLVLAYKIAKFFGKTIEEIFDFSEAEEI
jgi:putative transcriptional regulator